MAVIWPAQHVSAHCDYLSLSYDLPCWARQREEVYLRHRLSVLGSAVYGDRDVPLALCKPQSVYGYRGYRYRNIYVGYSAAKGRVLESIAGSGAHYWRYDQSPPKITVNRCDIAVDLYAAHNCPTVDQAIVLADDHISRIATMWRQYITSKQRDWTRRRYTVVSSLSSGTTVYLGTRASARFARLYNKTGELASVDRTPVLDSIVRMEIQLTGPEIDRWSIADYVAASSLSSLVDDVIASLLPAYGIYVSGTERRPVPSPPKHATWVDRRLAWIRDTVLPSLRDIVSAGYGAELDALGIRLEGGEVEGS